VADAPRRPTVIAVENALERRQFLRDALERYDVGLLVVENGVEAIEAARVYRPTLLLLDADLTMGTVEVVKLLRAERATCDIPIWVLSGEEDRVDYDALIEAGVSGGLSKRMSADQLAEGVLRACGF
jgi:two-component system cell cycle response regulator DivK